MTALILPIINLNPDFNYSQRKLIHKLQEYVSTREPARELPFDLNGLCSGLIAYWLYSKRIGEEGKFIHKLEHAINWSQNDLKVAYNGNMEDPILEQLINDVAFLQYDKKLRENTNQDALSKSFELLLNDNHPRVNDAEFKILFVFNRASLEKLINDTVFENKMIRIDTGMHTVGLMRSGDVYYFNDPENAAGIISFAADQNDALADAIFHALSKSSEYVALYVAIFDIDQDAVSVKYPDSLQYCKDLLQDPHYKSAVLQHDNIFHLGIQYEDYKVLDLLFATDDYKPIPWKLSRTTEYEDAIIYNNFKKFKYLLDHKMPVNYAAPYGITPLATAVKEHNTAMAYNLLVAGADPNLSVKDKLPMFVFALKLGNVADLTLLLAAGLKLSSNDERVLRQTYSADQIKDIKSHALLLQAKLNPVLKSAKKELLKTVNQIIEQITKKEPHEFTSQEKQDIDVITSTLNQLLLSKSDITEAILAAKTKIDKYLDSSSYKPNNLFFRQQSQGEQTEISYERDILPLLNLKLN